MGELRYHFPVAFNAKNLNSELLGAIELITMASESHSTHLHMNTCKSLNLACCLNTGLYLKKIKMYIIQSTIFIEYSTLKRSNIVSHD